jgi:hypothetical protein
LPTLHWTHLQAALPLLLKAVTRIPEPSRYYSLYWQYPIEVFVLAYDVAGNYLGYAQVGYVQAPSTTRSLNIAAYNLPMNTKFQYAFRVNGGGSNSVEYPPTISRVAASVN